MTKSTALLESTLAGIQLLALDVDGVLTDGRLLYTESGETMRFDVQDGLGIKWLIEAGICVAWISGRGSPATARRARELGVRELHTKIGDKAACLESLRNRLGFSFEETASMGDDLPDLGLATASKIFLAPRNARAEVRESADFVTECSGGRGAVRELAELLLRAKGYWPSLLERFSRGHDSEPAGG